MVSKNKAEQYEELVATLKFTPRNYTVRIQGYGGECYAGRVERRIYDYFKSRKLDLEQYASDWDNEMAVPDDLQPFPAGSAYECDNIFHASGAELSNLNELAVDDENGQEVWSIAPGPDELDQAGIAVGEVDGADLADIDIDPKDTVIVWGGQGEKGCFFEGEFELTEPFDPKLLSVQYANCDGWLLITGVEYRGVEIDGWGGYSTNGKWAETKWILDGDEEVYEPEDFDPDSEDELPTIQELEEDSKDWDPVAELDAITESMMTEWYDASIKPVRPGEYEVKNTHTPVWPFPASFRATWTGRTWQDSDGEKVANVVAWRGLNFDPNEVKFDWSPLPEDSE